MKKLILLALFTAMITACTSKTVDSFEKPEEGSTVPATPEVILPI